MYVHVVTFFVRTSLSSSMFLFRELNFKRVLKDIAKKTRTDADTDDLGVALGIDQDDIDGYKVANQSGRYYEGTHDMLKKWSRLQHQETRLTILRQALEKVGRRDLCESMDRGESSSSIPDVAGKYYVEVSCYSGLFT